MLGLLIDAVVHGDHLTRQIAVAAHERVERLTDHRLRVLGEPGNGDHRFELRLAIELNGPLAHILGQVSDAFQLGCDFHDGRDEAQIDRRGLHLGNQLERAPIDLQLHLIDPIVIANDFLGERRVALQ